MSFCNGTACHKDSLNHFSNLRDLDYLTHDIHIICHGQCYHHELQRYHSQKQEHARISAEKYIVAHSSLSPHPPSPVPLNHPRKGNAPLSHSQMVGLCKTCYLSPGMDALSPDGLWQGLVNPPPAWLLAGQLQMQLNPRHSCSILHMPTSARIRA